MSYVYKNIVPKEALRDDLTDVTTIGNKLDGVPFDLMIDTSPCQPWSRLRDDPKGFDEPGAKPFIAANALYKRVRNTKPHIQYIVENVEPKSSLLYQKDRMEAMWGSKFTTINAKDWGSPSSRPRNYCTNICTVQDIPGTNTPNPNLFISDDHYCEGPHMPCIVASEYTRNVPVVKSRTTHKPRRLTVAEAEALQMWPPHITDGFQTPLGISQSERHKMVGNAVNGAHLYEILKRFRYKDTGAPNVNPVILEHTDTDKLDHYLWEVHRAEGCHEEAAVWPLDNHETDVPALRTRSACADPRPAAVWCSHAYCARLRNWRSA